MTKQERKAIEDLTKAVEELRRAIEAMPKGGTVYIPCPAVPQPQPWTWPTIIWETSKTSDPLPNDLWKTTCP